MQPPTEPPQESLVTALGALGGGFIVGIGWWLKKFLEGHSEGASDVHGKQVILEQAELADVRRLENQVKEANQKADELRKSVDQLRQLAESNHDMLKAQGPILRDVEIQMAIDRDRDHRSRDDWNRRRSKEDG